MNQAILLFYFEVERIGSPGIAVIVTPAVALLAGGSATAAKTGSSSWKFPESQRVDRKADGKSLI
jgi:hypothetical protein